jgi:hypothetical protein
MITSADEVDGNQLPPGRIEDDLLADEGVAAQLQDEDARAVPGVSHLAGGGSHLLAVEIRGGAGRIGLDGDDALHAAGLGERGQRRRGQKESPSHFPIGISALQENKPFVFLQEETALR